MDVMDLHEVGYVVTAFFDCNGLALGMGRSGTIHYPTSSETMPKPSTAGAASCSLGLLWAGAGRGDRSPAPLVRSKPPRRLSDRLIMLSPFPRY
jgi:hypothetical protein